MAKVTNFNAPVSLPSAVRAVLEEDIVFNRLLPGERVTEIDLSARYKVSRSPIREALFQLEKDRLVVREPRRGFWVAPLSLKELDEIYVCRVALEGIAAQEAAEKYSKDDGKQLDTTLRALHAAVVAKDVDGYFRWNVALTDHIHVMADNEILLHLLDGIGKPALRYRYLVYSRRPDKLTKSVSENRRIVAAIKSGNANSARKLTESLIRESWIAIREALAETISHDRRQV